jgi:hypothetical protein
MINWQFFPQSAKPPEIVAEVVRAFEASAPLIESGKVNLKSNASLTYYGHFF